MMKYLLALLCFVSSLSFAQVATNNAVTPLPSTLQTATTVVSPVQQNFNYRGGHFNIYVQAFNSGTYTPHIQALDPISNQWYDLVVGNAINAAGITTLKVYPGITASANVSVSDILPLYWRVELVGASTPSMVIEVDALLEL